MIFDMPLYLLSPVSQIKDAKVRTLYCFFYKKQGNNAYLLNLKPKNRAKWGQPPIFYYLFLYHLLFF